MIISIIAFTFIVAVGGALANVLAPIFERIMNRLANMARERMPMPKSVDE